MNKTDPKLTTRDPRYDSLFEPVKIGPVTVKNRFCQAPPASPAKGALEPRMAWVKSVTPKPVTTVGLYTSPDASASLVKRGVA